MCTFQTITVFLAVIASSLAASEGLGKCCDLGEILKEFDNSSFTCIEDGTKRRTVFVPETKVIKTLPSGSCLEYSTNFFEFEFLDEKIIKKTSLDEPFFPKCCPIGYIYDSLKHSCEPKTNFEHNFINEKFVQVGLPQCHLIFDTPLRSIDNTSIPEDDYCYDETSTGYVRRQCTENSRVCDDIRCVKKCCPDGQSFVNGPYCFDTYKGLDLNFSKAIKNHEDSFAIIFNSTRCTGKFYLMSERRFQFHLLQNGEFQYWNNSSHSYVTEYLSNESGGYCIEHSDRSTAKGFFFFHCLNFPNKPVLKFEVTKYPKILSCIFLALTILIYWLLGQARKLFGKILINYCIAAFFMYVLLVVVQFSTKVGDIECQIFGFSIIFVATVSFAWLNIMCCDIWLTFGSTKQSLGVYQRRKDLKKYLIYVTYGWGMPLLLSVLIYVLSITKSLPDTIRPYVGIGSCFFERRKGNYAQLVFLRIPHLIMQLVNVILFLKTILYCLKIKNEIDRINDNRSEKKNKFNRDKEKLFLILKLAVVMGITFIFDTVTAFVDFSSLGSFWSTFEIVVDCINCLQGVYIFIIFICKRTIYNDFLITVHIKKRDTYLNTAEESSKYKY